ncbi:riboflavin biosynthesis protein RibD C-terminal domain protein [Leptospira wolbachii serovar Codice str. CDC]|uniref:Riboflavin biosynthesis protein RibD C-terminal domain protein n=1 Tax=Leptospira wolbachii serovar Codice str. CDC TaxID=1218599 RepID=R9A8Y7_9LEPT|nr:dihydrofolate reductase family protein [Leptospira wolbachii]EOQ96685.1 riboflavin biosynthesis protein RibD C-terminal domain protein [Leptospira wolbachii serovar Codice str. CDC]
MKTQGTLSIFLFLSLDGFYKGENEDISWHSHGAEESKFSEENLNSGNTLLFGKRTFLMMESFWTSKEAFQLFPKIAEQMKNAKKLVLSHSEVETTWNHTETLKPNWIEQIMQLKKEGTSLTILGSGEVVRQCCELQLLDEYLLMIDPIAIGSGQSLFGGLKSPKLFPLKSTRTFTNGSVLLKYGN